MSRFFLDSLSLFYRFAFVSLFWPTHAVHAHWNTHIWRCFCLAVCVCAFHFIRLSIILVIYLVLNSISIKCLNSNIQLNTHASRHVFCARFIFFFFLYIFFCCWPLLRNRRLRIYFFFFVFCVVSEFNETVGYLRHTHTLSLLL